MKCDSCKHALKCPAKAEQGGAIRCSAFKPLTNEEWLHTLPMEEMADEIIGHIAHEIGLARYYNDDDVKEFVEWLKEEHKE